MNEVKESDKLAEKLSIKATFEISAGNVLEFDALLVEIKKKKEQYITFSLDVTCKWEYKGYQQSDNRVLSIKNVPDDSWANVVNRIRDIETQVITYLNEFSQEDDPKIEPIFSCTAKLHIEYKDKEAQKSLEDDKQLVMFSPIDLTKKQYDEKFDRIVKDMKPDGENISSITFQRREHGVAVGEGVELKA